MENTVIRMGPDRREDMIERARRHQTGVPGVGARGRVARRGVSRSGPDPGHLLAGGDGHGARRERKTGADGDALVSQSPGGAEKTRDEETCPHDFARKYSWPRCVSRVFPVLNARRGPEEYWDFVLRKARPLHDPRRVRKARNVTAKNEGRKRGPMTSHEWRGLESTWDRRPRLENTLKPA